jgi:hypothetical protein
MACPRKLTVIFDRSTFHGEGFDRIAASPLEQATRSRSIVVHHTGSFLEETFSLYEREKNRDELRRQVPYLLRICNGRWLRSIAEIWRAELVLNRGPAARVWWKTAERAEAERILTAVAAANASFPGLEEALREKDAIREVKLKQRAVFSTLRHELSAKAGVARVRIDANYTLEAFLRKEGNDIATEIIRRNFGTRSGTDLVRRWCMQPHRYRYLTKFLRGWAYCSYYAMIEQNKPLDTNAMTDVAQLTYLWDADVIVSADQKFQRDAFYAMWDATKQFWTPDEFLRSL